MKKACANCKQLKSQSDFYKDSQQSNGLKSYCKECVKKRGHDYYRRNREKAIKANKLYRQTSNGKKVALKTTLNAYRKYPQKGRARSQIRYALLKGKLKKRSCEIYRCEESKTEAHHSDYSKPLDVIWLCRQHHMIIEGRSV